MCLCELRQFKVNGKGYQVVKKVGEGQYTSIYFQYEISKLGEESTAVSCTVHTLPHKFCYPSGFHIFTKKAAAMAYLDKINGLKGHHNYIVVRVSYSTRGVTTGKYQLFPNYARWTEIRDAKVVVARKRTIREEIA